MINKLFYYCDECNNEKSEIISSLEISSSRYLTNFSFINSQGNKESIEFDGEEESFCPNCNCMNTFYIEIKEIKND